MKNRFTMFIAMPASMVLLLLTACSYNSYENIRILDSDTFAKIARQDTNIPTSSEDIIELARAIYPERTGGAMRFQRTIRLRNGTVIDMKEDGEYAFELLYWALQNPDIDESTRDTVLQIKSRSELPTPDIERQWLEESPSAADDRDTGDTEASADADIDDFEEYDGSVCESQLDEGAYHVCITANFRIRWYDSADDPDYPGVAAADIIPPESVNLVYATAAHLENARQRYLDHFSKTPLVTEKPRLLIQFENIGYLYGVAGYDADDYEDHRIRLNSVEWLKNPNIIPMVTAHELFHHIQYAFGYRSKPENEKLKWFTEGTASWAESFVTDHVRNENKLTYMLDNPAKDITQESYEGAEFWYFFHDHLDRMKAFMDDYDAGGVIEDAIDSVLEDEFEPNNVYRPFDNYLALYRRNRVTHEFYPNAVLNEYDEPISPGYLNKYFFRAFEPGSTSNHLVSLNDLDANGTGYVAFYIDPALKNAGKQLRFEFQKDLTYPVPAPTPGVNHQYQFIYAKCDIAAPYCGFTLPPTSSPSYTGEGIPRGNYTWTEATYPFFADEQHEAIVPLDESSLEWDLIFIPIGVDKLQTNFELHTFLEDS